MLTSPRHPGPGPRRAFPLVFALLCLLLAPTVTASATLNPRQQAPPPPPPQAAPAPAPAAPPAAAPALGAAPVFAPCPTTMGSFRGTNASLNLQCTTVSVPLTYDDKNPSGVTIPLLITKLPASSPSSRIGNLFVNPGGPGAPASTMVTRFAQRALPVGAGVLAAFDIIGMDPRGTGLSSPTRCDVGLANQPSSFDGTTTEGFKKLFEYNRALGETCRNMTGPLFDHVDTVLVARDMEMVRVALGNEPMNYFGQSYGTQLGAQYAALFPAPIRAMVLDGVLQHSGSAAANVMTQTTSLDASIQNFFRTCEANATFCGLSAAEGAGIRQTWATVIATAGQGKLKAAECDGTPKTNCLPDVTVSDILGAARGQLEVPRRFKTLAKALTLAAAGNASSFAEGFISGDVFGDAAAFSIQNVQCQDGHFIAARSHSEIAEIAQLTRTLTTTPGMGEFWTRVVTCTGYPVRVSNPRAALDVKGLQNPALLVHSRFDPATSIVYAQGMLEEIRNATLLVRDGAGHTSYFNEGAAARAIDEYLLKLVVPAPGAVVPD